MKKLFDKCCSIKYKTVGHDVNYAFLEKGRTLTIFFQGSSSTTDWLRNFLFKKRPYKDMDRPYRVHRGFLAAWKEVEDIIIDKITELAFDKWRWKKIIVVGYSHGGALAAFCHECVWFWREDLRKDGLVGYGFEAPRIFGGFKVPKDLKERWETFTVVRNKNDIVTHCPPKIFGYSHVGKVLKIGKGVRMKMHTPFPCVNAHFPDNVSKSLSEVD